MYARLSILHEIFKNNCWVFWIYISNHPLDLMLVLYYFLQLKILKSFMKGHKIAILRPIFTWHNSPMQDHLEAILGGQRTNLSLIILHFPLKLVLGTGLRQWIVLKQAKAKSAANWLKMDLHRKTTPWTCGDLLTWKSQEDGASYIETWELENSSHIRPGWKLFSRGSKWK